VNGITDLYQVGFAGVTSASGFSLDNPAPGGKLVRLVAVDARSIDISNRAGDPISDYGLYSVENGQKAAALYIQQGISKASNYVVNNIASRDSLMAIIGDQAHVLDKGDGEWGLYLFDGSSWMMIASYETSVSDANTYQIEVTSSSMGENDIGEISDLSKVTNITVEVIEAFDTNVVLTIGDTPDPDRLAGNDQFDLGTIGVYVVLPSFVYDTGNDFIIKAFLSAASAPSTGRAKISLSYQ
jgi:hypothetical protein